MHRIYINQHDQTGEQNGEKKHTHNNTRKQKWFTTVKCMLEHTSGKISSVQNEKPPEMYSQALVYYPA